MKIDEVKAEIALIDSYVKKISINTLRAPRGIQNSNGNMILDYTIYDIKTIENQFFGEVDLIIKTELSDQSGIYTSCELVYSGLFNANIEKTTKEEFEKLRELNGIMILFQLSRSLLTSVTAQAGIFPPVTLPLINIYKVIENKKATQLESKKDKTDTQK